MCIRITDDITSPSPLNCQMNGNGDKESLQLKQLNEKDPEQLLPVQPKTAAQIPNKSCIAPINAWAKIPVLLFDTGDT